MSRLRERLMLSTVNVKRIQKGLLRGVGLDYTTSRERQSISYKQEIWQIYLDSD